MSHYIVYVCLNEEEYKQFLSEGEDYLYCKLGKFDEKIDVEPYEDNCGCIGLDARISARKDAEKQLNWNWSLKRKVFWESSDTSNEAWSEFIKPYVDLEEKLTKEHPMYNLPDKDCDNCNGTGKYASTYNPNSKWDWYAVGGRWNNCLENLKCIENGNAAYGEEIAEALAKGEVYCWGLVVPDYKGEIRWAEKGKVGWFGVSTGDNDNWEAIAHELLMKHKNDIFVAVDCHI